jgi:hypothetical protein
MAGRFNLSISQGATYGPIVFKLRNTIVLSDAAAIGATSVAVSPLAQNVTSGATLTFGTIPVVTSASASIGDRTISVVALTEALTKGLVAKGDPIDLTGKSARAQIRQQFTDAAPLASFTCSILSPATLGEVSISLPSTTSATLPANINPDKSDDIADLQAVTFPSTTENKLFLPGFAPYYWDLELYSSDVVPVVDRYIYGRVVVTAEVTR